jgi:hypothetical protein
MFSESRVERWRGGLGRSWFSLLARPFVCECHNISTMLRFHLPLIEPDVRISRIRLSDWLHLPAHEGSVLISVVTPKTSPSSLASKVLSMTA